MMIRIVSALLILLTLFEVSASPKKEKVMAFFQMTCDTAQPNPCQQLCVDMQRGGFYCRCQDGYTVNKDGMTCKKIREEIPQEYNDDKNKAGSKSSPDVVVSYSDPGHGVKNNKQQNNINRSPNLNEDGEVVIHDKDVVHLKSIDLTKGLPPLESDAHRRNPKTLSSFVPDHHYYNNVPSGEGSVTNNDVYFDSFSPDVHEGGDDGNDLKQYYNNNEAVDGDAKTNNDIDDSFYYYDEDDDKKETAATASCTGVVCRNNGTCIVEKNRAACHCPLGTAGRFCEKLLDVKYPKFYGNSYLALPILRDGHKEFSVSIQFRPESQSGLLLFSGEKATARSDFMSVSLENGFVVFRFDCGTGPAILKTPNQVILARWNRVVVRRVDNQGSVQLNDDHQVESTSQGDYSRITFRLNLYVGGYSDMESVSERVGTLDSFVGCVQEMVINGHGYDFREKGLVGESEFGMNVGECSEGVCDGVICQHGGECTAKSADSHICLCPIGYHGDNCEKDTAVHIPHFSGHSYLEFPGLNRSVLSFTEIEVVFKPTLPHGSILYNGFSRDRRGDFISLALQKGHVEYRFDLGTGPAVIR